MIISTEKFLHGLLILAFVGSMTAILAFSTPAKIPLSTLEIEGQTAAIAGSGSNLLAHYAFDEASGTTVADSEAGNTGTLVNGTAWSQQAKIGTGALSFDGVDDLVRIGSPTSLTDISPLSVSAWVSPNASVAGENFLVSKINTTATGWRLSYSCCTNNNLTFRVDYDGASDLIKTTSNTLTPNSWQHVVVTWDGSTSADGVHIYINGSEASYSSSSKNGDGNRVSDVGRSVTLGNINNSSRPFGGQLDDVYIYGGILSSSDIAELYSLGGSAPSDSAPQPNPPQTTPPTDTPTDPGTTPPATGGTSTIPPSQTSTPASPRTISWKAPLGVPEPEFGIREDVTMYLQSGATYDFGGTRAAYPLNAIGEPYTHYIDPTHGAATDTSNPYGSPDKPRKTLPAAIPAGSVVELHGTIAPLTINAQGTSDRPVFIRGQSQSVRGRIYTPDVVSSAFKKGTSYVIVENLLFEGKGVHIPQNVHHISLRYLEITGQPAIQDGHARSVNALAADSGWKSGEHVANIVFFKNNIHDNGSASGWPAVCDCGMHGISIGDSSYKVWVVDNEIYRNNEDGIHVIDFNKRGAPTYIYIARNRIYDNGENAVDIKQASDIIVSQNQMYHYRPTSYAGGSDGTAVVINNEANRSSVRTWIINNEIYDSTLGLRSQGDQEYYVIGNVFHDIRALGATGSGSGNVMYITTSPAFHIVGNTLYNFDNGIIIQNGINMNVLNNLVYGDIATGKYHLGFNQTTALRYDLQNNLVYSLTGAVIRNLDRAFSCANCILTSDPKANGYVIPASSPAVDKGVESSVYETFSDLYGLDIRKDINGTSRPLGNAWDIGAYESNGSAQPAPTSVNGSCGIAVNTCLAGTYSDQQDSATQQQWQCVGSGAGATASCTLPIQIVDTIAPSVPLNLTATAVSSTQINLSWSASTDNVGVVGYRVYQNGQHIATPTALSLQNSTVLPGTNYTYTVAAYDAAGNASTQSVVAQVTTPLVLDTSGPVISTISSVSNPTAVTINWTTDEPADSQIEYGLTTAYGKSTLISTVLETIHAESIVALDSSTLYHYRIISKDAKGNRSVSLDRTFTTLAAPEIADTIAPVITSSRVTDITDTSATITWTTNEKTSSTIDFGASASYGNTRSDTELTTSHSITLTSLVSKTMYHFKIISTDAAGNVSTSTNTTFTTKGTKPPTVTNLRAQKSPVVLSWKNPSVDIFDKVKIVRRTGNFAKTLMSNYVVHETQENTWTDRNVTNGTTYYYTLFVVNKEGTLSEPAYIAYTPEDPASAATVPVSIQTPEKSSVLPQQSTTLAQQASKTSTKIANSVTKVVQGSKSLFSRDDKPNSTNPQSDYIFSTTTFEVYEPRGFKILNYILNIFNIVESTISRTIEGVVQLFSIPDLSDE